MKRFCELHSPTVRCMHIHSSSVVYVHCYRHTLCPLKLLQPEMERKNQQLEPSSLRPLLSTNHRSTAKDQMRFFKCPFLLLMDAVLGINAYCLSFIPIPARSSCIITSNNEEWRTNCPATGFVQRGNSFGIYVVTLCSVAASMMAWSILGPRIV
jgi:hypothetical protein